APGRPLRGDRPAGLAGPGGAGLGRPERAGALPDPDVTGRLGAAGRRVAGVLRRWRRRTAPAAVADLRAGPGARLGGGDRLGATAADLGADRGRGVCPSPAVPLEFPVPAR